MVIAQIGSLAENLSEGKISRQYP